MFYTELNDSEYGNRMEDEPGGMIIVSMWDFEKYASHRNFILLLPT
jgi:hypothetical protein